MTIPRRLLPAIQELHAFEAAARFQSISDAARELNLTQSAVSRQIKSLEHQLGLELFVREKQTIKLTFAGQNYAREVREALRRISTASLNIRANPMGGTLNVGTLPSLGSRWLAERLPDFCKANPNISLNVFTRITAVNFQTDTLDAAFHYGKPDNENTVYQFLFGEEVAPMAAPSLVSNQRPKKPEDIRKLPLLILLTRPDAWERWLEGHGADANGIHGMMFDTFDAIIRMAISGMGAALLPTFLVKQELRNGSLIQLFATSKSSGSYYLGFPKERERYTPLIEFCKWLGRQK